MMTEITQEQRAAKIAEWIGFKKGAGENWFSKSTPVFFCDNDWLSTLEGEVAIMDKLLADGMGIFIDPIEGSVVVIICWPDDTAQGTAPTRNAALQQAISAMLERKS